MRPEVLFAALFLLSESLVPADAGLSRQPEFSAAETQTIGRNALLSAVVDEDPWLVRRILDLVQQRGAAPRSDGPDPDLASGPRGWQATVEWNDLIKRARAEKDARAQGLNRSSEGTVLMIDMMKRVKDKKAGAPQ